MKDIFRLLFLFINLYLISPSNNEPIFHNPNITNKSDNPINYKIIILSDDININLPFQNTLQYSKTESTQNLGRKLGINSNIALSNNGHPPLLRAVSGKNEEQSSEESSDQNKKFVDNGISKSIICKVVHHYDKLYYNSYALSPDFFLFKDNSNIEYLFLKNKLYKINKNPIETYTPISNLEFLYVDYITSKSIGSGGNEESTNRIEEIILYGKENEHIAFYNVTSGHSIQCEECKDLHIDESISCKLLEDDCFICTYSQENQVKLSILCNINNEIILLHTYNDSITKTYLDMNTSILYDTNISEFKIICGIINNDNSNCIKCIAANITFHHKDKEIIANIINFYNISDINTDFSFNNNSCNYAIFNSEYLICCIDNDLINCDRRDINDLSLINTFYLEPNEKIRNLTVKNNNDTYIELLYNIEKSELNIIYEYRIYPPKCVNKNISLIGKNSTTIDLNSLFERKTNTKYFFLFNNISDAGLNFNINGEHFNDKYPLDNQNNELYIEIKNIEEIEKIDIEYSILVEETYSDFCNISFTFNPCYAVNVVKVNNIQILLIKIVLNVKKIIIILKIKIQIVIVKMN